MHSVNITERERQRAGNLSSEWFICFMCLCALCVLRVHAHTTTAGRAVLTGLGMKLHRKVQLVR